MTVFMTGFPGFLGSALLPRILGRTEGDALCLVQPKFAAVARRRLDDIYAADPSLYGRIKLVEGDITVPGLGLPDHALSAVSQAWHLAAIYDLTVARDDAVRVNVQGTGHVLNALERRSPMTRLHYFSTCYVSGRYAGPFGEDDLEVGAAFNNYYEETKHQAEVEVRRRMTSGMPATIYRPSIVVGDSRTGATLKYDGPYFLMQWLLRQRRFAVVPMVGDPTATRFNIVPRNYVVDAVEHLSGLSTSLGRTYHLADPAPLTVAELTAVLAKATQRRAVTVPLPRKAARASIKHVPGLHRLMQIPAESVDYFSHPTHYSTDHSRADLAGSGITVPTFGSYADRLVEFMRTHPEIGSAAMS